MDWLLWQPVNNTQHDLNVFSFRENRSFHYHFSVHNGARYVVFPRPWMGYFGNMFSNTHWSMCVLSVVGKTEAFTALKVLIVLLELLLIYRPMDGLPWQHV